MPTPIRFDFVDVDVDVSMKIASSQTTSTTSKHLQTPNFYHSPVRDSEALPSMSSSAQMKTAVQMDSSAGRSNMEAWVLNHDNAAYLQYTLVHGQAKDYLSDASTRESDQSSDEDPDSSCSWSTCSTSNALHMLDHVPQLEGLFQIPAKHLLPGMSRVPSPPTSSARGHSYKTSQTSFNSQTSYDSTQERFSKPLVGPYHSNVESRASSSARGGEKRSRLAFPSRASSDQVNTATFEQSEIHKNIQATKGSGFHNGGSFQQLTASVIAIRGTWAALESSREVNNWQTCLQLVTELAGLISVDGCTLFQYHVSHLLEGGDHDFRMKKLWTSLSAGQKTYWRKHSAKFQIPVAFEHWQLALRNLETDDHGERYSSIVRKAKRIIETASEDAEGHLIASPNWRNPVPERELQLWRLDKFAATKKLERRVQQFQGSFGPRRQGLYRKLGSLIDQAGWTMFVYHGVPRIEEAEEEEAMAKLKAIWNGMTADDMLYWRDLSCRLTGGLRCSLLESLAYFSFDAWAVKEARQSAEAWGRLQVQDRA